MQSGRKSKTIQQKELTNTVQKCRDAGKVELTPATSAPPIPPVWLSPGAKDVWMTDIQRAASMGLTDIDQSMFALYCETMASFIDGVKAGAVPNAAFRSELRKQMELLGMAGAKSRLTKIALPEPKKLSPFSIRKKPLPK